MSQQVRHWCFTWYEDKWPIWNADKINYMVYQTELCPETARYHVQGYIEFKRSMRINSIKKILGSNTIHLEPRMGSRSEARNYCMKEESRVAGPWEFGEWKEGETKRDTLATVIADIQEGKDWEDLVKQNPAAAIRYYKNMNFVWQTFNVKKRDGGTEVHNIYIFGDAGVGKTRFCHWYCNRHGLSPYTSYIRGTGGASWWQRYLGQECAIYDDFDGSIHMDVGDFKKICDRYPFTVPTKGGDVEYSAVCNFFTSNTYPIDWYPRNHWDAIKRRASHCIWWRVSSRICETCDAEGFTCPLLGEIEEAVLEWELDL